MLPNLEKNHPFKNLEAAAAVLSYLLLGQIRTLEDQVCRDSERYGSPHAPSPSVLSNRSSILLILLRLRDRALQLYKRGVHIGYILFGYAY
jgi:hypothetical protein